MLDTLEYRQRSDFNLRFNRDDLKGFDSSTVIILVRFVNSKDYFIFMKRIFSNVLQLTLGVGTGIFERFEAGDGLTGTGILERFEADIES